MGVEVLMLYVGDLQKRKSDCISLFHSKSLSDGNCTFAIINPVIYNSLVVVCMWLSVLSVAYTF
jgi:hypothetical protein